MYFISAAVILLASLALIVQVSLPYNKTGRASTLYSFILVFLSFFCGLNTLFKIPVTFSYIANLYHLLYNCVTLYCVLFVLSSQYAATISLNISNLFAAALFLV